MGLEPTRPLRGTGSQPVTYANSEHGDMYKRFSLKIDGTLPGGQTRNFRQTPIKDFVVKLLVWVKGFEPPTFGSRSRRSTRLSYTQKKTAHLSGRRDSNSQPPVPKTGALPD